MGDYALPATIAIVGGGFTGAAVAYHLARQRVSARVIVFEPRSRLGAGLAYDTQSLTNRINVPATRMSLLPDDEEHFARWIDGTSALYDDPDAVAPDGQTYPRRAVFGRYVNEHLLPHLERGRIRHVRSGVAAIARAGDRWKVTTDAGAEYHANVVVIATTHPAASVPAAVAKPLARDKRLIADATGERALADVKASDRVVIVGTGLTMADIVAELDHKGHTGRIIAFSRRGLLSRGHARAFGLPFGVFAGRPHTALSLLRSVRQNISAVERSGGQWQWVIDAVRGQAQEFWPKLGSKEQAKIIRYLRPYWDAHRFRIAPQVAGVLSRRIEDGSLEVLAASLDKIKAEASGIRITVRPRRGEQRREIIADRVILATGPAHGDVLASQQHLTGLAQSGLLRRDELGLGIKTDAQGHAVDAAGNSVATLFIAGPLARATFGELMGLPQVSDYALKVANQAAKEIVAAQPAPRIRTL